MAPMSCIAVHAVLFHELRTYIRTTEKKCARSRAGVQQAAAERCRLHHSKGLPAFAAGARESASTEGSGQLGELLQPKKAKVEASNLVRQ